MLHDSLGSTTQRLSRAGLEWVWDPRAGILSLMLTASAGCAVPHPLFALRLTAWHSVAAQLKRELKDDSRSARLSDSLVLATDGPRPVEEGLRYALGELAFGLLCRSLRKGEAMFSPVSADEQGLRSRRFVTARGRRREAARARLRTAAESVLCWLGPDSQLTAWRYAYAVDIEYQRRYQLTAVAQKLLAAREAGAVPNNQAEEPLAGDHARHAFWWTTRCLHDFALRWCLDEPASPAARAALVESRARYLALVREEPRRATFESFVRRTGSKAEWEVMRVLHAAPRDVVGTPKQPRAATPDELLRDLCAGWMLRRYSLWRSLRLVFSTLTGRDFAMAGLAAALLVTTIVLFRYEIQLPLQVLLQLLTLGFLALTPKVFRLLLPRALFGSLAAWLTIVITQTVAVFPLTTGEAGTRADAIPVAGEPAGGDDQSGMGFRGVCHKALAEPFQGGWQEWGDDLRLDWSHVQSFRPWKARQGLLALLLGCLLLIYVFVSIELKGRVPSASPLRPLAVVSIMVIGSVFWGMMFSPFVRVLVEGELRDQSCNCIWTILWLGSFGAVVFGILVQLLWEDHSLTDEMTLATT